MYKNGSPAERTRIIAGQCIRKVVFHSAPAICAIISTKTGYTLYGYTLYTVDVSIVTIK